MATYYVNNNAQSNGDHEVHKTGCVYMPSSTKNLGEHSTCQTAVTEAKRHYWQSNGCAYCASACHTS